MYKRQGLGCEDFKLIFAYFCLKSYFAGDTEFTEVKLRQYIELCKAKFPNISFKTDDFLTDLTQSVCMLVKEGINYRFTHRSFQEYFAAWYTCKLVDKDQVLSLIHISFNLEKEPPKRINIRGKELYYLDGWNGIDVVEKLPRKPKEETEWDKQQKKNKELEALQKKMDARRQSFIRMIIIGKIELLKGEERQKVIEKMIRTLTEVGGWINERRFSEVYTGKEWYGMPEEERNEIRERIRQEDIQLSLIHI